MTNNHTHRQWNTTITAVCRRQAVPLIERQDKGSRQVENRKILSQPHPQAETALMAELLNYF